MRDGRLLTLPDYAQAYADGSATPAGAVADVYRRIEALDDPAIFIALRPENEVVREADALAARHPPGLPLYGIPVAIKDNIDVAGLPTTAACPDFSYMPDRDATAVARLRAAGAIVIGKTNLDQFATGLVGVRSPYGSPRNTFRADIVPGGSSSGSAVAVAAGLVPVALGTDTAGSGRVPAGLNNIAGLKPSLGAVSTLGVVPACRSLDCVSVFALTVEDAFAVFRILAAYDEMDPLSRRSHAGQIGAVPPALRIGCPDANGLTFGGDVVAHEAFETVLAGVGSRHRVQPIDTAPLREAAALLYDGPWIAERHAAIRKFFDRQPDSLLPVTRSIIGKAEAFSATDAFSARDRLAALKRHADHIWRDIDVLIVPTFPRPRSLSDVERDPIGPNAELGTYTNFVNLLDMCALAIPCGLRADGLPAGVTLIAPAGQDALIASFGAWLQSRFASTLGATGQTVAHRLEPSSSCTSGEIEIAVVGAHMSGMALNHELTRVSGRFLRAVPTDPHYRLFALPGGPPARPGLLRIEGEGHRISTEVWALAPAAFGAFVAGVPAPLAIGTLSLSDGSRPKGFIVEHAGTVGARDISAFGGWRSFVQEHAT